VADNIFSEALPAAKWAPDGGVAFTFPVERIKQNGKRRNVKRERPYRNGAKIDTTGREATVWNLTVCLENSIQEKGVPDGGTQFLYPTVMNKFLEAFDLDTTGDLTIPTRGVVRAKFDSYDIEESPELQDGAKLTLVFIEDNEDRLDATTITAPTANASLRTLVDQTVFSAQSDGAWDGSLADLNAFAANLEAIANFPGDTVTDLDNQAGIMVSATNRVGRAFSDPSRDGRDTLNDPESSQTQRKLHQTRDIAGSARRTREKYTSLVFDTPRSLFVIAADLGQIADDLLALNGGLDPFFIPAGTPVRVLL
jgi:prophage DNA circulation protein